MRPRRFRRVHRMPQTTYFKPAGVRMRELQQITLTVGEYEAVRLKDFEGLDQEDAAKKMQISQPTFHRLVLTARKKISDAIVNGKAIKIEGGNYKMVQSTEGSSGRMGGPLAGGPGGVCKCIKCGHEVPHQRGIPCSQTTCPKCSSLMTRG